MDHFFLILRYKNPSYHLLTHRELENSESFYGTQIYTDLHRLFLFFTAEIAEDAEIFYGTRIYTDEHRLFLFFTAEIAEDAEKIYKRSNVLYYSRYLFAILFIPDVSIRTLKLIKSPS